MNIPDFQTLMLPLLKYYSDNLEHSTLDTVESLAQQFNLTEEEIVQLLPSGRQSIFKNRVYWAIAHLKMGNLIENTQRAHYKITSNGLELLSARPEKVNLKLLKTIPEYIEHTKNFKKDRNNKVDDVEESIPDSDDNDLTPEENLEYSFQRIQKSLARELLQKIKKLSPSFFERLVIELLVKMGYGGSLIDAGKSIGKTGDEGIDGIIKEDKLGLDVIYVQAKRWEGVVGRPELQKFVGALAGQGAKKGIFITTSYFSKEALEYTPKSETKIVLIDGEQLSQYMIDFSLGVSTTSTYEIKKIDLDYFEE
ncbi:MAG: restriction endonuclease [Ignavibacterium sp.]